MNVLCTCAFVTFMGLDKWMYCDENVHHKNSFFIQLYLFLYHVYISLNLPQIESKYVAKVNKHVPKVNNH